MILPGEAHKLLRGLARRKQTTWHRSTSSSNSLKRWTQNKKWRTFRWLSCTTSSRNILKTRWKQSDNRKTPSPTLTRCQVVTRPKAASTLPTRTLTTTQQLRLRSTTHLPDPWLQQISRTNLQYWMSARKRKRRRRLPCHLSLKSRKSKVNFKR